MGGLAPFKPLPVGPTSDEAAPFQQFEKMFGSKFVFKSVVTEEYWMLKRGVEDSLNQILYTAKALLG